ncbi:NnrU family protein [Roseomonas sp. SSH11]|uniref:NnrU family protein n=1 Tax=Pararoseomonas baculiformis TaxID=2820812 RepID=A0ABS4ALM4_9PROT|nr:NnrU family protein [Pararoseomonas baculiformis]MBP0447114.1 NnrU family protein [Pararoseomonas baculiformis]
MTPLVLAALIWIVLHVGIAGTRLRGRLVSRLGEGGFRATFSLASVIAITLLVLAWRSAPTEALWTVPPVLGWVLALAMLPAFILFAGSLMSTNPTAVGQNGALSEEARGVLRITRHPMLWSFALWAGVHMLGNGDSAALVFFGAFFLTALLGMPSLDAKVAARHPRGWARFSANTSVLPFGAVLAGLNQLSWRELAGPVLVGILAWAALLHFHPQLFGVSPLPS